MLFAARALQGAMAAVMAPSALSLIQVTFTEPKERARAFGVFGGISGGGAAIGLILGGLLTQYVSWRWTLLINVPIAIGAALLATRLVHESRAERGSGYDIPGAVTSTLGLLALVYGFTKAETDHWGSATTLSLRDGRRGPAGRVRADRVADPQPAAAPPGSRGPQPGRIVPLHAAARYRPVRHVPVPDLLLPADPRLLRHQDGFAFLPFSVGIVAGAAIASQLLPRIGPRPLIVGGLLLAAGGLVVFSQVGTDSLLFDSAPAGRGDDEPGRGNGLRAAQQHGLDRRRPQRRGSGQRPGEHGPADRRLARRGLPEHRRGRGHDQLPGWLTTAAGRWPRRAAVHGYTVGFSISAGLIGGAAVLALLLLRANRSDVSADLALAVA